ncbi:MAG: hypothetical protein HQ582_19740 [Planctomycetes bacterium]|nr:hypothetical protein [Planctomycetota bacterium]
MLMVVKTGFQGESYRSEPRIAKRVLYLIISQSVNDEMEWPRKDEKLFTLDDDYANNACLTPYWTSLGRYGENYRDAADTIINAAINGDTYVDAVVYPAVFLYRHYLELTLKDIISCTKRLEKEGNGFPKTHKLSTLWPQAKRLLEKHYGSDAPKELEYLDGWFNEFIEHDPDSMAFRYPFDKDGNRHLMNLTHINVRHLMETMGRIACFLSCIAGRIGERLDWSMERDAEMRHEGRL